MKTVAYLSPFVPPEWIAAHGFRAEYLRLSANSGRPSLAVTRGICPYAGALIDAASRKGDSPRLCKAPEGPFRWAPTEGWSGTVPFSASAIILTTICDQMRYAAAILESRSCCPVFLLNVPSTWQTEASRRLYLEELGRLGRFLEAIGGKGPTNEKLATVMLEHDAARDRDRNEDGHRPRANGEYGRELDAFIPLALVGGPLLATDSALFGLIENAGGRVVLDATEGGQRTLPRSFDSESLAGNALAELADAYFGSIPDPFRRPNTRFHGWLHAELAARAVRGIVFRRYVWCDLWHAELHRVRESSGLPVLEVDVGPDDLTAPNRVQGRIEAFLETLRGSRGRHAPRAVPK